MKKIATILFSLTIGALVIALGAAVFLPSTKRARIDPLHRAGILGEDAPATQTDGLHRGLPGTKSRLVVDEDTMRRLAEGDEEAAATRPGPFLSGTKVGVFDTGKSVRQLLEGSPFAPESATQPATRPATQPSGSPASQDRRP